jgi:hypothetical protein
MATQLNERQLQELLYQGLETELGGVQVYTTALQCALNPELAEEWQKYLEETQTHVEIMKRLVENLGMDVEAETPGRKVVRHIGRSLVRAMEMALAEGPKEAAELVAAECVVHAETKDHLNWELLGVLIEQRGAISAEMKKAVKEAFEQVEEQEDEHLYHTTGWTRELWIQSLGLPAVLPPPEEEKEVKTAIGAARAKKARKELL